MTVQRRRWAAALAVPAAIVLVSCSATPDGGDSSSSSVTKLVDATAKKPVRDVKSSLGAPKVKKGTKLCYVTRTLSNEFWSYERNGFEEEAKELGVEYKTYAVNDESSITEQLDKAQTAMKQECDALLASPISATGLDSVYKAALSSGKPAIVLNDAKGTVPGVVYVGPDAKVIGKTAADYIAKKLPDGGAVAMIEGDPGSSNALNRGAGFKKGLKAHPNLRLVASQTAKWDQRAAQDIATAMLTAHPSIKAFYAQNDVMALGAAAAIKEKGLTGKVLLLGTDGIPQGKKEIAAGNMTATVSERPATEGATGVDTALWLLAGRKVPGWVDVPAFIIDKQNVDKYASGMP